MAVAAPLTLKRLCSVCQQSLEASVQELNWNMSYLASAAWPGCRPCPNPTCSEQAKLCALCVQASEELLKEHYIALRDRPFYSRLVKYMSSGPVVAMVWQGLDVVKTVRTMIGETNPADARPGTIRGDFCVEVSKNVIHGSDSVESAQQEISLWFRPEELTCWEDTTEHWIYA
ncbi:PREDICTED: nucleoside diphosphate kinase A-like [Eurypyga helias]|uniref:nucleoside diphosphate kinase A-like n=1 Tax=Eurypyga helias TaxID=54383 RepID=UPI0005294062|nr:PREDICTED: nucleoside diphosphate kinase A-like [Eurypyga helias]